MKKAKLVVWLFAAVSLMSFVAALIPVFKDGAPNVVFLGSGTVFLVIAMVSAKKARTDGAGSGN